MAKPELTALADDIRQHGLNDGIVLFEDGILDGRNRHRACSLAKVTPHFSIFKGTFQEAVEYVWTKNFVRRHLNSSQAAGTEAKKEKMLNTYAPVKKAAAERKKATQAKPGEKVGHHHAAKVPEQIREPSQDRHARETVAIRAKAAGTNAKYIELADQLAEFHPELLEEVMLGKKTLPQVKRELRAAEKKGRDGAGGSQHHSGKAFEPGVCL